MSLLTDNIAAWSTSPLGSFGKQAPWELTENSTTIVDGLLAGLGDEYKRSANIAVHSSANIENGALLKGPLIVGPRCFVASGSLVRGGCWIDVDCIIGPGAELKSSFLFQGSKLAHFNFVGDSLLGSGVNLEAGSIIANYRNELPDPKITFLHRGKMVETGARKFGALVGDGVRVGANAVVAPGAILSPGTLVKRLALVDQRPDS